jgi:serine/threonine protein kinase
MRRPPRSVIPGIDVGSFELVLELERDELCSTWAALQHAGSTPRSVRLMRVNRAIAAERDLGRAFLEQAGALGSVRSRSLLSVVEAGAADGTVYLALEHLEAVSLSDLFEAACQIGESLPMPALVRVMLDVAEGLSVLHGAAPGRIAHGDLTPRSILVTPDGRALVTPTCLGPSVVAPSSPCSTRCTYKAPEQLAGQPADTRSDVFAFGAVMWEAVVGRKLFHGRTRDEIVCAIAAAPAPPLEDATDASMGLSYVLGRALDRDPAERFDHAGELYSALSVLLRRLRHGLTARRRYVSVRLPPGGAPGQEDRALLAHVVERLVGDRVAQRRADLSLLLD